MAISSEWLRSPVDHLAVAEGCYFDQSEADRVIGFVETFCRQSKGKWSGQPLRLLDWQRDALMRLFGWRRADGLRRYKSLYLEVAKKNGKSTLVSAIALYLLVADGEGAPEIYLNAVDKNQTRIVFDEAARMVRASPELARRLTVLKSLRILDERNDGVILANSKVVDAKDGLSPSGVIFDEVHRQPDRLLYEVFEHASIAREQPLHIDITTAGEDDLGIWHELREFSERTNGPAGDDTTHLGIVYRAEKGDDLDLPDTWRKANPSLGVTFSEDDFRRDLKKAKEQPATWANFLRLRFNIIAAGEGKFIDMEAWDACNGDPGPIGRLPCYGGLDLSSENDLTSFKVIFGSESGGWGVFCKFWLPEENIERLSRQHRVNYRTWADRGFITLIPGNVVEHGFIRKEIVDFAESNDLRRLCSDPWMATQLLSDLKEKDGLNVEPIRQGFISQNEPTKELRRLILGRKIRHGGNPILRWNASNAIALVDAAGSIKLDKAKGRLKIDGMAALVDAVAASIGEACDDGESVYESRGVTVL